MYEPLSTTTDKKKIAVIGAGVAGLGAAWLLNQQYDVSLFEKNDYIGGHSNTLDAPDGRGGTVPVDTGFIVYNERTYPNLIGMLDHLGVKRLQTDMSFAVTLDQGQLEYGGSTLASLFAQKRNFLRPRFYKMVRDILRFYKEAPGALHSGQCSGKSLGAFLKDARYSKAFIEDHLLPMAAAIWSCPVTTMKDFPADSFIRFCDNHGLLQVNDRPQWWTVERGSREYVNRILSDLPRVVKNAGIQSVTRHERGASLHFSEGRTEEFEAIVFACHGDEALALMADATPQEQDILSGFRYQANRAVLHTDKAQMPKRRAVWSSWNYLAGRNIKAEREVAVTYWMNCLQNLTAQDLFVTLNPFDDVPDSHIIADIAYDHPVFDETTVASQKALPSIQGESGFYFCGAYCGYGFHEDGLGSAVAVAQKMGVSAPWVAKPVHAMAAVLGDDVLSNAKPDMPLPPTPPMHPPGKGGTNSNGMETAA